MKSHPLATLLGLTTLLSILAGIVQYGWPGDFISARHDLVLLSGILLMVSMSFAMLLACRPLWLERASGGLDKLYALHKHTGITAAGLLAAHWLIKLSTPLAIALHWTDAMQKRGAHHHGFSLTGLASGVGQWAAWLVLGMVALALLRVVPYRFWRKLHTLFAPIYLMGVFHGVILMPVNLWLSPVGMLLAALIVTGSLCALWSMARQIGKAHLFTGKIDRVTPLPGNQLEILCQLGEQWPGHEAGQFARVTFDKREGAHPFTIASADRGTGELRFIIKALGDHTRQLAASLRPGATVEVEGPYGCFVVPETEKRQAWVAGGIGVTPFLAWLEARRHTHAPKPEVDFYYCVEHADQAAALEEIRHACSATGVRFHLFESRQGQRLHPGLLQQAEEVCFCGPAGLGHSLRTALAKQGKARFHAEAFSMR
jgi:predicted ferric reductase